MEFINSIKQINNNKDNYKKWEISQGKRDLQNKELQKIYLPAAEELENARHYGRTVIDNINIMDQHAIDKSEDITLLTRTVTHFVIMAGSCVGMILGHYIGKSIPYCRKNPKWITPIKFTPSITPFMLITGTIVELFSNIAVSIWATTREKQAARIARYQTRENDLKDPKNFVIYDDEQIMEAKKIAKTLPDIEEQKPLKNTLNPITNYKNSKKTAEKLSKDLKVYERWKIENKIKEMNRRNQFNDLNVLSEDLSNAEKDQENILNTIKKIEISSLNYMVNMELAVDSLMALVIAGGFAVGGIISKSIGLLEKSKIIPKRSAKSEIAKIAVPIATPVALIIFTMGPIIRLKKDAARIGRYKAKQELLNNPANFITYDEEQRKKVENTKQPEEKQKGFFAKFKDDCKAITRLKKDYEEYQNYLKTQYKEEQKLHVALKQVNISDKQKEDAVNLQKKAFYAFEKMDEMSQRYTDDSECAMDIIKHSVSSVMSTFTKIFFVILGLESIEALKSGKGLGKNKLKFYALCLANICTSFLLEIKSIQFKKEAGKIGLMEAMQDMDNPRNFLDSKYFPE